MNKSYKILITIIVAVHFFLNNIFATTYEAKNASEIANFTKIAAPGDTIIMKNGIWTNQTIVFTGNGTEEANIVLKAETPGGVILNGNSTLRIAGKYLTVDGLWFYKGYSSSGAVVEFRNGSANAYHCRLTNTAIEDYNPVNKNTDYKWVSIYGQNNRVDHCYFKGKEHSGTTLVVWVSKNTSPNYHLIDHNYFGYRPELGYNGGETIRVGDSDNSIYNSSTTVEYNYFERCNGETEIISNKSDYNIYRYNTFYECDGQLTLRHGDNCEVYGNYFFGNNKPGTGGVRIIGAGHKVYNNYFQDLAGEVSDWRGAIVMMNGIENSPLNGYFQVDSATVAFNTIVNCKNGFVIGLKKSSDPDQILPPKNSVFANNVIYNTTNLLTYVTEPINFTYQNNYVWGGNYSTVAEGFVEADPLMVMAEDSLWRPQQNSPLINSAEGDYYFVIDDIDGQVRDSLKDVGADEYSVAEIIRTPVTPESSGPTWLSNNNDVVVLTVTQTGTGEVILEPAGGVYKKGTNVTLTAIPATNSSFINWTGDTVTTENPITIRMNSDKNITANFKDPKVYKLAVWKNGEGDVILSPEGGSYIEGTKVIITAVPAEGWAFESWSNALTGNSNPDTVLMDEDKLVIANFNKLTDVHEKSVPTEYNLQQNYPNPFNPSTVIEYSIPEPMFVKILVYNELGQLIDVLVNEYKRAGKYQLKYNLEGKNFSSGRLFYRIETDKYSETKCMLIIK
jgi:poly(beta-D-mannuronate) lyase